MKCDYISKNELIELLKKYKRTELTTILGYSKNYIGKLIKNYGLAKSKIIFNCYFFETIDTEEKAYWLGYIAADGCVSSNNNGISITSKDKEHIYKWIQSLVCNKNSGIPKIGCIANKYYYASVFSSIIHKDIQRYGVVPKKSLILKFPKTGLIPNNLIRHFLRGYFDGDGCLSFDKRTNPPQIVCGFLGTLNYMNHVAKILKYKQKPNKHKSIYQIRFAGNLCGMKILDYLYENCNIYLDRKYKKYIEHKKLLQTFPIPKTENILYAFNESKTYKEWLKDKRCTLKKAHTIYQRIELGWEPEKAISTPIKYLFPKYELFNEFKTLKEWKKDARILVKDRALISYRLRHGWSIEKTLMTLSNKKYKHR